MLKVRVKETKEEGVLIASYPVQGHYKVLVAIEPTEPRGVGRLAEFPLDQLEYLGVAMMPAPPQPTPVRDSDLPIDLSKLRGHGQ